MEDKKIIKAVNTIFFDFDGTIADTAPGIIETLRISLKKLGKAIPSDEEIKATIGLPLWKAFTILGNMTEEESAHAVDVYAGYFMDYEIPNIKLFAGVSETLERLRKKGILMAIVTSRDSSSLNVILENNGIADYFEACITINDGLKSKPAPDMAIALLNRMNAKADETLVVGDTTFDILMGNNANCHTCAVSYGNHSSMKLKEAAPEFIIDHFEDIIKILPL